MMKHIFCAIFIALGLLLSADARRSSSRLSSLSEHAREFVDWKSFLTSDLLGGNVMNVSNEPQASIPEIALWVAVVMVSAWMDTVCA